MSQVPYRLLYVARLNKTLIIAPKFSEKGVKRHIKLIMLFILYSVGVAISLLV